MGVVPFPAMRRRHQGAGSPGLRRTLAPPAVADRAGRAVAMAYPIVAVGLRVAGHSGCIPWLVEVPAELWRDP